MKQTYSYSFTAKDEAGLESVKSQVATGKKINGKGKPAIKKIQFDVDRQSKAITLTWNYEEPDVIKYCVYRAAEGAPISLYKSISSPSNNLKDSNLAINTTYRYRVKAIFKDGSESSFSDEIVIKY
jgi:fibronectin type 3 domain-containing protein